MELTAEDKNAVEKIVKLANDTGIYIAGDKVGRTLSWFCLMVEHCHYNGTELTGIGNNQFIDT